MKVYALVKREVLMGPEEESLYYDFSAHKWYVLNSTVCSQFTRSKQQAEHYQAMYEGATLLECELSISVNK